MKALLIGGYFDVTSLSVSSKLGVITMIEPRSPRLPPAIGDTHGENFVYRDLNYRLVGETPKGVLIYEFECTAA